MAEHLLDYIAYKTGTTILSDLHDAIPYLRYIVEQIPLEAYPERDWLDTAHYLCPMHPCHTAGEAREILIHRDSVI